MLGRRNDDESLFDGQLLGRRLQAFLARMNGALASAVYALPDFEIEGIEVAVSIDAAANVSFAGAGVNLDRNRTLTFSLKPRKANHE